MEKNISVFDKNNIRKNALRFSKERFEAEFEEKVNAIYKDWKEKQ